MTDALFVLALVVPPVVVVACFALLVLPARHEAGSVDHLGVQAH